MKKPIYLFNEGRMSRKDNTIKFTATDENGKEGMTKYLPIEDISDLYVFGNLDMNAALLNFLGKSQIGVHFFDYYENYSGSFMPKEYLLAGKMQVEQTKFYLDKGKRLQIAQKIIEGAAFNMLKNLKYYNNRDKDTSAQIGKIETYAAQIPEMKAIDQLMGMEGNIRQTYYEAFDTIISEFQMGNRTKQPPNNEVNALISFGNMMCYTHCLKNIHHTQLNPTISFLHEPGYRRYSLALDLAEIFKPLIVDRLLFTMLNKKEIQAKDFSKDLNRCLLKESGKKTFARAFDNKLKETIMHRSLGKSVSYQHLIKLECYKLSKHILGMEEYKPFKAWW